MKRPRRPVVGNSNQILQPIREEDLQKLRELLREKFDLALAEYMERLCLFRMSVVGHIKEDKMNTERLFELVHKVERDELGRLPSEFEISRNIIIRMKEKRDFESLLEVRSTV